MSEVAKDMSVTEEEMTKVECWGAPKLRDWRQLEVWSAVSNAAERAPKIRTENWCWICSVDIISDFDKSSFCVVVELVSGMV